MARPSKAHPFTIYEDAGIPTPDSGYEASFDDAVAQVVARQEIGEPEFEADGSEEDGQGEDVDQDADDEDRRESMLTRTSISSLAESSWQDEKPYTPPVIRPSFMRPESVRRMQMSSPTPHRSPRQSLLRHSRSRAGTPRSVRSAQARGSPRPRRRISEETELEHERVSSEFPLVLLHVTLLPIVLPWSAESVKELVPETVLSNLQLLRSKASELIVQRGLLLPHPREDYELLEERLLEALELRDERVTKCGHYRAHRESAASLTSIDGSDSGMGSSMEGSVADGEVCETCQHRVKDSKTPVRTGSRKWSIRVYAANGLMRASAWAAAWSEMECVDVEILPWIDDELRRRLDERMQLEVAESMRQSREDQQRLHAHGEESPRIALETALADSPDIEMPIMGSATSANPTKHAVVTAAPLQTIDTDLPEVYRRSQVPLSIILKNYLLLLAQDRRNVVILFLTLVALWFGLRSFGTSETANASHESLVPVGSSWTAAVSLAAAQQGPEDLAAVNEALFAECPVSILSEGPHHSGGEAWPSELPLDVSDIIVLSSEADESGDDVVISD